MDSSASCPPASNCSIWPKPNAPDWVRAHLGTLTRNALSAASLAYAAGGVALARDRRAADAPLTLEFSGTGHVRAADRAGRGRVAHPAGDAAAAASIAQCRRRDRAGRERAAGSCPPCARRRRARCRWKKWRCSLARDARYHAHFASFGAKLSRLELDIALEGEGAEAHLSGVSVLGDDAHADITTHVIHAVGNTQQHPVVQESGGRQKPRRLSGQGDGGQGRRRLRQPPDRQGVAAGRRAPKPISSPNWKSSPMTSNAPMARRWATWMRIRCSICAPAAFPKPRPARC